MVVKSATKKKLMDMGITESISHILANDRKWEDIKNLNKEELKQILPGGGIHQQAQVVDSLFNKIAAEALAEGLDQQWQWWTPFDIKNILKMWLTEKQETLARETFIGAPILHLGYVIRSGIDTPEPVKSPRYQLGIITDIVVDNQTRQNLGYTLDIEWIKKATPQENPRTKFVNSWPPAWVDNVVGNRPDLYFDGNPNPSDISGTGRRFGPSRLIHTAGDPTKAQDTGLADVFLVLLSSDWNDETHGLHVQPTNPSQVDQEVIGYVGVNVLKSMVRQAFAEQGQELVFDYAIDDIIPRTPRKSCINWSDFGPLIGA